MARRGRWLGVLLSGVLLVGLLAAPARAEVAAAVEVDSATSDVAERPDLRSAALVARALGHRVEVSGLRDETTTWVNPDGTLTSESSASPVRVNRDGEWVPMDTDLAPGVDLVLTAGAH